MFSTDDLRQLRRTLDGFPIPMFSAQRPSAADAFRLLCINRAHEDESGLCNNSIVGLRMSDLLPADEAEAVEGRFSFCARTREVIQYDETLRLNDVPRRWRTILHPVRMKNGHQRVIGTSFPLGPHVTEPVGVVELSAAIAAGENKFGPVQFLLRPDNPVIPERRVIQAEAVFRASKSRSKTLAPAPKPANGQCAARPAKA